MPALDIESVTGLSGGEAAERLEAEGHNELPEAKKRGVPAIVASVIREPMFLLLVASGLIYFALGDLSEGSHADEFRVRHHRHHASTRSARPNGRWRRCETSPARERL